MPKYKNTSQFSKVVNISGKRLLIKPEEIVFFDREIDVNIYDYLEKVDDKAQASVAKEILPKKISAARPEDIKKVQDQLTKVEKDIAAVKEETNKGVEENLKQVQETLKTVLNRLDVMKKAVEEVVGYQEEMSQVVQELQQEVYENGAIVIQGLETEEGK